MDLSLELSPRTRGRATVELSPSVVRDLAPADLVLLNSERGIAAPAINKLRDRHHSLARALAAGQSPAEASIVTGYSPSRISILQADPAFQELLEFYRHTVDVEFADVQARMATLATDFVEELHDRLEREPESMSNELLLDGVKVLADRTGNGPTSRSVNLNVNVGLAERMQAGLKRAKQINQE